MSPRKRQRARILQTQLTVRSFLFFSFCVCSMSNETPMEERKRESERVRKGSGEGIGVACVLYMCMNEVCTTMLGFRVGAIESRQGTPTVPPSAPFSALPPLSICRQGSGRISHDKQRIPMLSSLKRDWRDCTIPLLSLAFLFAVHLCDIKRGERERTKSHFDLEHAFYILRLAGCPCLYM